MLGCPAKALLIVWCREGTHHDLELAQLGISATAKLDDQHPLSTSPAILTEPITARCCRSVFRNRSRYLWFYCCFLPQGRLPSASLTSDAVQGLTAAELLLGMGS